MTLTVSRRWLLNPLIGGNNSGFAKWAVIGMFAAGIVDERRIAHLTLHEHDDLYPHVTRGKVGGVDVQRAAYPLIFLPCCHQTDRRQVRGKETLMKCGECREFRRRVAILDEGEYGLRQFSVGGLYTVNIFPPLPQCARPYTSHASNDGEPQPGANELMSLLKTFKFS
jgi:hypothetical protein